MLLVNNFLQQTLPGGDLAGFPAKDAGNVLGLRTTNDALRRQVARMIELGISQVAIAKRLQIDKTRLNRWVNDKRPIVVSVDEMDRLDAYLTELEAVREWQPKTVHVAAPSHLTVRKRKRG